MKPALARIREQEEFGSGLFPFLAVMICTIGSLVFILAVSIAHVSKQVRQEMQGAQDEVQQQEDFIEIATKELHAQRKELQTQVERAAGSLNHLQDHIARLEKELAEIQQAIENATNNEKQKQSSSEEFDNKKAALEKQLEYLQAELNEKIEAKKTTRPAFCIIPYKGPNGTSRRPIYLECTSKGVTIQPEGKLITLEDLRPPHGPGNPLDAALRTIRTKLQHFDGSSGTAAPYPLLIVRPDGIASYSLARAAMAAWDDQHGYELIDADMPLTYPPSLPGLREELDRVVARAQQRQQELIASLPKRFASSIDRSTESEDLAIAYGDQSPLLPDGRVVDSSEVFMAQDSGGGPHFGGSGNGRGGSGSSQEDWPELSGSPPIPKSLQGKQQGSANTNGSGGPFNTASMATVSELGQGPTSGNSALPGGSSEFNSGDGGGSIQGGSMQGGANSPDKSQAANQSNSMQGSPTQFGSQGSNFGTPTAMSTGNSEQDKQLRQEMGKSDPKQPSAIARPASSGGHKNHKSKRSQTAIANEMGDDWAVQHKHLSNTPIHRSIHIKVLPDRWQIVDPQTQRVTSEIFLGEGPRISRQWLHASIRKEVNDWGVAVSNGYWVPLIKIYESGDSAWAAQQLSAMLEGSGAKIEVTH